jgi:hypothetical protein
MILSLPCRARPRPWTEVTVWAVLRLFSAANFLLLLETFSSRLFALRASCCYLGAGVG